MLGGPEQSPRRSCGGGSLLADAPAGEPRSLRIPQHPHPRHPRRGRRRPPRFGELFPEIGAFIGDDVLAAHNAAFDLGVIRSGLEVSGLAGPAYDYVCTVMLSRRCYSLVSNSLPYAAEEAGVPLVNHHDAAEDARACAGILVDIARRNNANSIAELYLSLGLNLPQQPAFDPAQGLSKATMSALAARTGSAAERTLERPWACRVASGLAGGGAQPVAQPRRRTRPPAVRPDRGLHGRPRHTTAGGKIRAADMGARPESRVTARTTVLMVGDGFVAGDLRAGRLTGKAKRVLELHAKGQQIEVVSEGEFLQMVGGA